MTSFTRSVALVGRPNVGKSRLFNRLAKERISIVHDQAGVTRDVITADIEAGVTIMDTGGIGMQTTELSGADFTGAIEDQVDFAIQAADVILFVVDTKDGCTAVDSIIAEKLRRQNKPTLIVANKVDREEHLDGVDPFYELGLGEPIAISAEHGHGEYELKKAFYDLLGPLPESNKEERTRIQICFSGRPNVGKSSIVNALLKSDRLIVSDIAGTTRDAVQTHLDYTTEEGEALHFEMMDTAGIRAKRNFDSSVEYFSSLRTDNAIESSDVIFLVLDAREGVGKLDKKLAKKATEVGKGVIVLVNKWDVALNAFKEEGVGNFESEAEFRTSFEQAIRKELYSLPNSPILFVSATENYQLEDILIEAHALF